MPTAPQLQVLDKEGVIGEHGFSQVEGRVKNLTGQSLRNVEAVVTWYTATGRFVTSDSAFIEFNPLLPGQISPFKVTTRTNPEMTSFSVEFKHLMGGTIRTTER